MIYRIKKYFNDMTIRGKIQSYILAFLMVLMAILWVIQVVFFNSIYKLVKRQEATEVAKMMVQVINGTQRIEKLVEEVAEKEVCIVVFNSKMQQVQSLDGPRECIIHKMSYQEKLDIINGLKGSAESATKELLKTKAPLEIINEEFVPALDIVGEKFEKGEMFLPQLMASAEAVKVGFELLKGEATDTSKGTIVVATVKGDIHDIGKNIVKMLLNNYGYNVIDLGKDVAPEVIVEAVKKHNAPLVGLSALMTTTVKGMEDTIKLLKENKLHCKVMVGGAVLTEEYAKMVGADFYAKDALEAVRIADRAM